MLHIYIDADACPVKEEVYRVARRYGLPVTLVANSYMKVPSDASINLVVVEQGSDAADDWIVETVQENDVVITGDIPLAARCLDRKAKVLGLKGKPFTEENVADALANRHLLKMLREQGVLMKGPSAFEKKDRSLFLQSLDQVIQAIKREAD